MVLLKTEEIDPFSFVVLQLGTGRQLAGSAPASGHSAVTKRFQLCSVGPHWGALVCPCIQRNHCYSPGDSVNQQSQLHVTHLWGISSKQVQRQGGLPLRNTLGGCRCPPGIVYYALCHTRGLGNKVPAVQLVTVLCVFVWTWVTYSEEHTDLHSWLVDSWSLVQGRVRVGWNNHCLLFSLPSVFCLKGVWLRGMHVQVI